MSLKNLERRLREAERRRQVGDGLPVLFIFLPDYWEPDGAGSFRISARYTEGDRAGHQVVVRLPDETIAEMEERCRREYPGMRLCMAARWPGPSPIEGKAE